MAGYETMTPAMWQAVVTALGPQAAEAWRRRGNIPVQGMPSPLSQPAAASATVPLATQGTTPMPVQPPLGGLAAGTQAQPQAPAQASYDPYANLLKTQQDIVSHAERQQAAAQPGSPDFKAAEDRIKQQFAGPSTSDRLWALSQALLSPKPYRGFAGTMYNLSKSFGGLNERASEAEKSRAQALAQLRDTYAQRASAAELAALKARGELAEFGIESAEKRAKAMEPSVQLDQQGRLREVPKHVFRPTSRAEYDSLPVGAYYVVPDGPRAGQIVIKTASGG